MFGLSKAETQSVNEVDKRQDAIANCLLYRCSVLKAIQPAFEAVARNAIKINLNTPNFGTGARANDSKDAAANNLKFFNDNALRYFHLSER